MTETPPKRPRGRPPKKIEPVDRKSKASLYMRGYMARKREAEKKEKAEIAEARAEGEAAVAMLEALPPDHLTISVSDDPLAPLNGDPLAPLNDDPLAPLNGDPQAPIDEDTQPRISPENTQSRIEPVVSETQRLATPTAAPDMGEAFRAFIEAYKDKPVEFVVNVLGATPLPWQSDFLQAVARGERRISVRAGHGVGKSTACSWALIWFMLTRYPQKSVCTAPTASQLYDALFAEVKLWVNKLPPVLRETIDVLSDRIVLKASPEGSFLSARTSSKDRPEAMAGIHSENVLLIFDEASAVDELVFESAAGSMSGHSATTILIGNPTRNSGLFFKTHHALSSEWKTMHVSCRDNPLVSADFIKQIIDTYGENSNAYRVRVLGEFALREDDTLIPAELVDSAMVRDIQQAKGTGLLYGLDVARFGDDRSVLVKRRGNVVEDIKAWNGADLMETVGRVVAEARLDKPEIIMVDSIGVGAGVADRLRELGLNVRDVNVSETAAMEPTAAKLRDELWISCKNWLATRAVSIPKHDELRQELVAPTYTFLSNGKIKVEGKADMKKRGMRSPDIADALCLTFAGEGALIAGRASRWITGQPLKRNIKGIV